MKKCQGSVNVHKNYDDRYRNLSNSLSNIEDTYSKCKQIKGNQEEILQNLNMVESLIAEKHNISSELNATVDCGENVLDLTAPSGKEAIKAQLSDIQQAVKKKLSLFDK